MTVEQLKQKFCTAHDIDGIATATEAVRDAGGKFQCGKIIVLPANLAPLVRSGDALHALLFLVEFYGYQTFINR